jgi:hypothetical protein
VDSDTPDALATGTTAYERRDLGPPGPGRVFGEFWWRSLALATAGGCVIGFVVGPVFILVGSDADRTLPVAIYAAVVGAVVGAAVGVMLGILAGVVMGAVGAIWLVPYRGKPTTTRTLRVVWFPLLAQENVYSDLTGFDLWAIVVPALAGAWYVAPWVGGWYVDRMREPT